MDGALNWHVARAMLEWQREMGVDEAIVDAPIDRYAQAAKAEAAAKLAKEQAAQGRSVQNQHAASPMPAPQVDPVDVARQMAAAAADLPALQAAMAAFPHCDLQRGARSLVFGDGIVGAPVMILGEAPGRDEDIQGKPFVGRAGQLLDRMLAAIDRDRRADDPAQGVYISNVLPWRPPQNRDPRPDEIAMMMPFVERHVLLVDPKVLIVMGNIACQAVLGKRGITRLRGTWHQALGRPALPMFHPAFLLRQPHAKREAWADLLALRAHLEQPLASSQTPSSPSDQKAT